MTTRELIESELQHVPDERLDVLYGIVKQFAGPNAPESGILARLRAIQIDAPPDFSTNLDLYVSGEKRVEDFALTHSLSWH